MITRRKLVGGLLVSAAYLALIQAPAWAGLEQGVAAYRRGDYATALRELRPLAETGVADAQNYLGAMFHSGHGVRQDHGAAAKWFRRAADQGVAAAQYNLGVMYALGQGLEQSYVLAHMWISLASAGLETGKALEYAVRNLEVITRKMTPAQIAEAQRLARAWTPRRQRSGQ